VVLLNNFNQKYFSLYVQNTTGLKALDQINSILANYRLENALWVLPNNNSHRQKVLKILKNIYKKRDFNISFVDDFQTTYETKKCDCIVVCGNAKLINEVKQKPFPLIMVPFGLLDAFECQNKVVLPSNIIKESQAEILHFIIDSRLIALTDNKKLSQSMCKALLEITTSLMESSFTLLHATAFAALEHSFEALKLIKEGNKDAPLEVASALYLSSICAQNRGPSLLIEFSHSLAVSPFSNIHQGSAAVLPMLLKSLKEQKKEIYAQFSQAIQFQDPLEFVFEWIEKSSFNNVDTILRNLCSSSYHLLSQKGNFKALEPILKHCNQKDNWL
jgi:hypothetical protein